MQRLALVFLCSLFLSPVGAADPPPARVVTATVKEAVLSPATTMVGVLRFARLAEVAAEVEGLIIGHHFDTGWPLKKGAPMVRLDHQFVDLDIAINRAEAAELAVQIEQKAREVKRIQALRRKNLSSDADLDEAVYGHRALQKRSRVLDRQRDRLALKRDKSTVRAPFDGIVLEKKKDLGDWLEQGEVLARFGGVDTVNVVVPVAESLLRHQRAGDEFEVRVPSLDRSLKGTLTGIVPFAELRSKSVYLKIALPYQEGMVENASAEVRVATEAPRRLRLVPRAALLQQSGADTVYTVTDGKAEALNIHIVTRTGDFLAVDDEAVRVGMPVVVDGNDRLKPGQAVTVLK